MRISCLSVRLSTIAAVAIFVTGCQQADQLLPFDLGEDESATVTIGPNGGTVTLPPSLSLDFPSGAVGGSVSVQISRRQDSPFPADAGEVVPGTAFYIEPAGTDLNFPIGVQMAFDPDLLGEDDAVRLSIAVERADGSVATFIGTVDLTNGLLTADIDELGSIAAVVTADAIPVALTPPPPLTGGTIPQPASPAPSGPALTSHGGVEFTASCSSDSESRLCFSSGLVRLYADETIRERMGETLFLLDPALEASLEFLSFDSFGIPTQVVGSLILDGDLKARLGAGITVYDVDDVLQTGTSLGTPSPTGLTISGGIMFFDETLQDDEIEFNQDLAFAITGIGTSEMLTVEVTTEIEFENESGPPDVGVLTAHIRLRR